MEGLPRMRTRNNDNNDWTSKKVMCLVTAQELRRDEGWGEVMLRKMKSCTCMEGEGMV